MTTMKTKYQLAGLLLVLLSLFSACADDGTALTPSGIKTGYVVPQGTNDYDKTIVDFYKKYGSYLLYKFTGKDTYWTPSGWKNGVIGSVANGDQPRPGYVVAPADTQYVAKQVALIQSVCFSLYPDTFLTKFIPVKVFLCSSVQNATWLGTTQTIGKPIYAYYNYDNVCLSYGSKAVDTIRTAKDTSLVRAGFNRCLMESMVGRGMTFPTTAFISSADYTNTSSLSTNKACWARGLFPPSYNISVSHDWYFFLLMMVTYPESYLNRTPVTTVGDTDYTEAGWDGLLNPAKDINGLMKKRYNIVRKYFIDNYGMDLQKIGNLNKNYQTNK